MHAGDQFPKPIGLGDVIHSSKVKPLHDVLFASERRHDDDGHRGKAEHLAAHLCSRNVREQQVEENKVGRFAAESSERLDAVRGHFDLVALP